MVAYRGCIQPVRQAISVYVIRLRFLSALSVCVFCPYSGCIRSARRFLFSFLTYNGHELRTYNVHEYLFMVDYMSLINGHSCEKKVAYIGCIQPVRLLSYRRSGGSGWHGGLPLQWMHTVGAYSGCIHWLHTFVAFASPGVFCLRYPSAFSASVGAGPRASPNSRNGCACASFILFDLFRFERFLPRSGTP